MNQAAQHLVENRSSLLIFRDCLKLSSRIVKEQHKVAAIRKLLRREFEKNKDVFDQDQIKALKMNAVKGISNYIIYTVKTDYEQQKMKPININQPQQEQDLEKLHTDAETEQKNKKTNNVL